MELSTTTNSAGYPLAVTGSTYVTPDVRYLGWWRGVAVTRFIRSTKLLYAEPG